MTASETRMEQIKKVWEGISKNKVANQKWPYPESNFSLLEALDSWGYKSLSSEINAQYNLLKSAIIYSNTPIVMVSGMLNAGKSSVTASFLNQSSKDRIPRGLGRRDGTHRFVLWMPKSWERDIEHMRKFVTSKFSGTEDLPIDPDEAKKAYNATNANTDLLSIPLLAFDSELQDIAILDCPDAQRKHEGPAGIYDPKTIREEFLKKANELCAVLLFVTDLTRIEDQSTSDLLNKLHDSSLPLLILINSINPEKKFSPENFITDYQNIMAKIKAEYYIAYNFNDKEFDPWFESNQTIYSTRKLDKNNLPIFFRIPVDNPPQILNDRVREFQGNSLSETFVSESIKLFKQKIEDALKQVRKEIEKSNMDKIWNAVADGISQCVFDDGGNPRLPIKPSLKRYLEDAFMKTAPGWLKLPFVLKLAYRSVKELFKRSDKQKTTLAFQGMILTPKKLSDSFRVVRTWPERNRPNDSEFDAASEKIINNINNKIIFLSDFADDSNLNKEEHEGKKKQIEDFKKELEKACDSVWKSIPNQQKITSCKFSCDGLRIRS